MGWLIFGLAILAVTLLLIYAIEVMYERIETKYIAESEKENADTEDNN